MENHPGRDGPFDLISCYKFDIQVIRLIRHDMGDPYAGKQESDSMDTGLAWPPAMGYSLDLPCTWGSMEVACRRLVRRRKNLAAGLAHMKSHSRGVAGERLSRKGPRLADIACGPRLETKNESFVHADASLLLSRSC